MTYAATATSVLLSAAPSAHDILLLKFAESHYTGVKIDQRISGEVDSQYGVHKLGKYQKNLIKEGTAPEYRACVSGVENVRRIFKDRTLKYSNGIGIVPGTEYVETMDAIDTGIVRLDLLLDDLVPAWPGIVAAQEPYLGEAYNLADYPSQADIRGLFGVKVQVLPFPQGANLNVQVPGVDIADLQAQVDKEHSELIEGTLTELWTRLQDFLYDWQSKLSSDKEIRNRSQVKAEQVIHLVQALNFTRNPAIETMSNEIATQILGLDLKEVNKDEVVRKQALGSVNDILETLSAFA